MNPAHALAMIAALNSNVHYERAPQEEKKPVRSRTRSGSDDIAFRKRVAKRMAKKGYK